MLTEVMEHFKLERDLLMAGYYETDHHRQLIKDVKASILAGRLVAVAGVVGSGKTVLLRRIQDELTRDGRVTVSKSLSVDKDRTTIPTLITALFHDLSPDKDPKIPTLGEKRERELQQLVRRGRKPVALFVDEAHDLHGKTLIGLKRLMEVVADGGGMLSVVLVGHPKLRNDLRRPTMEEIGYRSVVFEFDGMAGNQLAYIRWLLARCAGEGIDIDELIETAAVELLAKRLKTPLQIVQHLTLAFEEAYRIGDRPVTAQVVESILSRQLDDLEPRLTRHGYSVRSLADQFSVKPAEIRQFLRGELSGVRAQELTQQMQAAGLPL
ncbi:ExeA family protein [Azospirillum sp. CT11-132]|uniref:ExeA family protein n=1 Tax=Azospirillum sp. CT11-132 TaxID=3396317 RepID=UPI0039A5D4B2